MSNKEEILDNVENVAEETAAAATIKPKGKADTMNAVMQLMSNMSVEDLNGFVATMNQYAANKDWGVGEGNASRNASTIMAKPSYASAMKEDLEAIFNGQDLSEEFKEKAETLFETAINVRLVSEIARLEEEYEEKLTEDLEIFSEQITSKLDSYLDYVVENWMQENEVAIESTLRNELMEDFLNGLKNLFAEHYISIPEEKVDVVEALTEKVNSLEEKLDESITYSNELKEVLVQESAKQIFASLASDLALTQQEKFATLAEGIEFDGDLEVFAKKLTIIKESYFGSDSKSSYSSNFEEETFEGDIEQTKVSNDVISRYAQAITKTVKN
jgi:hypothetical protein